MKIALLSGLFLMGIILFSAGDTMKNESKDKVFILMEGAESNITVESTGDFFVKIKSNPSTGYGWAVQKISDETVVKFKGIKEDDEDDEEANERPLMGAPTYDTFIFAALKQGKAEVSLVYRRPWEKDVPPIKTHKIHISIE